MNRIAITACVVLLAEAASAHPDHAAGGDFGFLHHLTDPFHVGLLAVAAALMLAVHRTWRRHPSPTRLRR